MRLGPYHVGTILFYNLMLTEALILRIINNRGLVFCFAHSGTTFR